MNMSKLRAPVWMPTAANIMVAPIQMVRFLPRPSERYGANGYAAKEPIFWGSTSVKQRRRVERDATSYLDSVEQTEHTTMRVTEIIVPEIQRLE